MTESHPTEHGLNCGCTDFRHERAIAELTARAEAEELKAAGTEVSRLMAAARADEAKKQSEQWKKLAQSSERERDQAIATRDRAQAQSNVDLDKKREADSRLCAVLESLEEWSKLADHLRLSTDHHRARTRKVLSDTPGCPHALRAQQAESKLCAARGLLSDVASMDSELAHPDGWPSLLRKVESFVTETHIKCPHEQAAQQSEAALEQAQAELAAMREKAEGLAAAVTQLQHLNQCAVDDCQTCSGIAQQPLLEVGASAEEILSPLHARVRREALMEAADNWEKQPEDGIRCTDGTMRVGVKAREVIAEWLRKLAGEERQ